MDEIDLVVAWAVEIELILLIVGGERIDLVSARGIELDLISV